MNFENLSMKKINKKEEVKNLELTSYKRDFKSLLENMKLIHCKCLPGLGKTRTAKRFKDIDHTDLNQ